MGIIAKKLENNQPGFRDTRRRTKATKPPEKKLPGGGSWENLHPGVSRISADQEKRIPWNLGFRTSATPKLSGRLKILGVSWSILWNGSASTRFVYL